MKKIFYSFLGIILVAAPEIVLAQTPTTTGQDRLFQSASRSGLSSTPIYFIIENTMLWLMAILGFIAIIGFVIAGILYLTAAGDSKQADQAKAAVKYSIFGVIVALIGFIVIRAASGFLNASRSF